MNDDVKDLYEQGNRYFEEHLFEEAIKSYSQAILNFENGSGSSDVSLVSLLLNRALCYHKVRDYDKSLDDCTCALALDTNNAKAYLRRAMVYEYQTNYVKALNDVKQALSLGPSGNLLKTALSLQSKFRKIVGDDQDAMQLETPPSSLVTEFQTLRLTILESPPSHVSPHRKLEYKMCIGNEFGLWNREILKNSNPSHIKILCKVMTLSMSRTPVRMDIINDDSIFDFDCNPMDESGRFKFSCALRGYVNLVDIPDVFIFRFSLSSGLPGDIEVMPVLSLPISLEKSYHDSKVVKSFVNLGQSIGASCIREIALPQHDMRVFGFECPYSLGIGGKLWDSTFVLLKYLHDSIEVNQLLKSSLVIELGCGTGLLGIGISDLDVKNVILTDIDEVVPLVTANIHLNVFLQSIPDSRDRLLRYNAMTHMWGNPTSSLVSNHSENRNICVLASDVVYDPIGYNPLLETLMSLLSTPRSNVNDIRVCYLAHRHRHPEDHLFFDALRSSPNVVVESLTNHSDHSSNYANDMSNKVALGDVKLFKIFLKDESVSVDQEGKMA